MEGHTEASAKGKNSRGPLAVPGSISGESPVVGVESDPQALNREFEKNILQILHNDQLTTELLDEFMESYAEDRTGQHPSVSDLIHCITRSYYDAQQPVVHSNQTKVYFLIGLGLEEAILGRRQRVNKSGQYNGVYYHLDSLDAGWFELKSTRSSPNPSKDGSKPGGAEGYLQNGFALRQFLSYAKTQNRTELDLGIIWLIQGGFDVYRVQFTQEEVDTNWEWISIRRDVYNEAVSTGVPPKAFAWNEDWECKNCSYQMMCAYQQLKGN